MDIILASTSNIRGKILSNAGITFSVVDPAIDETEVKASMADQSAENTSRKLARIKSEKVSGQIRDALVIGADQVLGLEGQIFNKPASRQEADNQLRKFRGNTHTLFSAVSCTTAGAEVWSHCAVAQLKMRNFTDEFLSSYLDARQDHYLTSVGGYKLEESGVQLFEKIEGDYFAILGLPLLPLLDYLRQRKIIES